MKKGKKNSHVSNRLLYTLITLGILIIIGVGVYAATYTASGGGHPITELSTCADTQILKMVGGVWSCQPDAGGTETDPTIPSSLKDGVQCSYSLTSCQDLSTVNGWTPCPSGKITVGVNVPCAPSYVCRLASIRCCSLSVSCS